MDKDPKGNDSPFPMEKENPAGEGFRLHSYPRWESWPIAIVAVVVALVWILVSPERWPLVLLFAIPALLIWAFDKWMVRRMRKTARERRGD